eukprot:CAMPEP_0196575172 /NCGR_PEP_ID=MMETSP1081-20130531/4705_1 /TAXON_ID=36882 /ORGANISM="Pyramimonas amylifera, Strain CCMP720" /LENGTH=271 /DNA_ID=CAMNT_0041893385 /DNA_START=233 /DNA_END=1044 /DNA_ORIENTATION=+
MESNFVSRFLKNIGGKRHPMKMFSGGEEDDILFATCCFAGQMAFAFQPIIPSWLASCHHLTLPQVQQSYTNLHYRFSQKLLYLHGDNKTLLLKSHLVQLAPCMAKMYPDARFITIVRPAAAQFCSWWSLQVDMSKTAFLLDTSSADWTQARLLWQATWNKLSVEFFGSGSDPLRRVMHFKDLVKDPARAVLELYQEWGFHVDEEVMKKEITLALFADEMCVGDKKSHSNVKVSDLNLTEEELEQKLGQPICSEYLSSISTNHSTIILKDHA